jgi:transposase
VAGITFFSFYFRLYKGSVKSAEVVDFLQALLRHIPGPLLIVWDRLSAHRSRFTRDFIAQQDKRLWVEYLPGYAPELNPVEYIWSYWKQHCLPNVCPKDYWSLGQTARSTLKRMRRRPRLITAFWKQAVLPYSVSILCETQ